MARAHRQGGVVNADPSRGFGAVASTYADLRPSYPPALFDFLDANLAGPRALCIDIGAGTGKASLDLMRRFERVIAVEPDPRMLDATPADAAFEKIAAAAEDVDFPASSVDCVTAATAFHWMDQQKVCANVAQWLRPHGVFFPFLYGPFYIVGPARAVFEKHWALWAPFMDRRLGAKANYAHAMNACGAFSRLETFSAPFESAMPPEEAAGLLLTASYARAYMADRGLGEDYRQRLSDELSLYGEISIGFPLGGVLGVRSE